MLRGQQQEPSESIYAKRGTGRNLRPLGRRGCQNLTFFKDKNKKDDRFISPNGEFHFKWSDVLAFEENNGDNLVCSPLENNKPYIVTLFNGLTHTLRCKDNVHPYKVPLFVSDDGSIQLPLSDLSFVQDIN